ncbi:MAG: Wzz/FepE/Etk N-terminal domain-containing protein [Sphaerochaeta sp.]
MHDGISVAELMRIFFRRINWIILVTVIVVGLGFIYIVSRPPIYEASVKLEVEGLQNLGSDIPTFLLAPINSAGSSITFEFNNARVPVKDLTQELEYVTTSKTITNALEGLNLRQFPAIYAQYTTDTEKLVKSISQNIEVTPTKSTNFVEITFNHSDKEFAVDFLDSLVDAFEERLLGVVSTSLTADLERYQKEFKNVEAEYNEIKALYDTMQNPSEMNTQQLISALTNLNTVKRSIDIVNYQLSTLTHAVTPLETLSLKPSSSKGTNKTLILAVALLLGGALGILTALLVDMTKETIDAEDLLYRALEGVNAPVESLVAYAKNNGSLVAQQPQIAQEYNYLAATLLFGGKPISERIFTVASPKRGNGNTFTIANMGVALASTGKKVLLIDANCEGKTLSTYFGITPSKGLSDYLATGTKHVVEVENNLFVLPFGSSSSCQVLHHPSFEEEIETLRKEYDLVLIDAPSFEQPIDVISIASVTEGVILNVRSHQSTKTEIQRITNLLGSTKTPLFGVIFNGVKVPLLRKNSVAASSKEFKLALVS